MSPHASFFPTHVAKTTHGTHLYVNFMPWLFFDIFKFDEILETQVSETKTLSENIPTKPYETL